MIRKCCLCLSPTALAAAIATGIFVFVLFPNIIDKKIEEEIIIKNGSDSWERFVNFPITVRWGIYYFHIKNADNFTGDVSMLQYEERGPYIFDEYWTKVVSEISSDEKNLTYKLQRTYTFNPKLSGNRNARIEKVNIVNPFLTNIFADNVKKLTIHDTAENIAFAGTGDLFTASFFTKQGLKTSDGPRDMFSTEEEALTISTGKSNPKDVLKILSFPSNHRNVWDDLNDTDCNALHGTTDGTQFHPNVKKNDLLWAYEPLICRELSFRNELENVEIRGIKTLRFVAEDRNFQSNIPENKCFCYKDHEPCEDDTFPLTKCGRADTMDIMGSTPYFRMNPKLRKKIGLEAPKEVNNENYGTYADIEPLTGSTLSARKRLQLSLRLKKDKNHPVLKDLPDEPVLIPILWVEETADLDAENAQTLYDKIFTPKSLVTVSMIVLMSLFIILFVGAAAVYYFRSRRL